MKLTILLLFISGLLFSQDSTNYRFSFGVSGISIMHYGLTDLKNVPSPIHGHYNKVYQTEKYTLDYENFTFSRGVSYQFAAQLISRKKYSLRFGANVFTQKYSEKLTYTLTDIGDGSTIDYGLYSPEYTPQNIQLGFSGEVIYNNRNRKSGGYGIGLLLLRRLKNSYKLGLGICYYHLFRSDWYNFRDSLGYLPLGTGVGRGSNSYTTKKVGVSLELQKSYKRFNAFINLSQAVYTAKRENEKGGSDFYTEQPFVPISQNLDFRFPLIIRIGLAVEFNKIKK